VCKVNWPLSSSRLSTIPSSPPSISQLFNSCDPRERVHRRSEPKRDTSVGAELGTQSAAAARDTSFLPLCRHPSAPLLRSRSSRRSPISFCPPLPGKLAIGLTSCAGPTRRLALGGAHSIVVEKRFVLSPVFCPGRVSYFRSPCTKQYSFLRQ
jgi:hypothetical protein